MANCWGITFKYGLCWFGISYCTICCDDSPKTMWYGPRQRWTKDRFIRSPSKFSHTCIQSYCRIAVLPKMYKHTHQIQTGVSTSGYNFLWFLNDKSGDCWGYPMSDLQMPDSRSRITDRITICALSVYMAQTENIHTNTPFCNEWFCRSCRSGQRCSLIPVPSINGRSPEGSGEWQIRNKLGKTTSRMVRDLKHPLRDLQATKVCRPTRRPSHPMEFPTRANHLPVTLIHLRTDVAGIIPLRTCCVWHKIYTCAYAHI